MSETRIDGRLFDQTRPIKIQRGFTNAAGSVLISSGNTMALCTASVVEEVPAWMKRENDEAPSRGWLTAEYRMLPGSVKTRKPRQDRPDGRATEIQRLIGRSLRAVVNAEALGPRTVYLDCDILQADGGTRTLCVSGACVALVDALVSIRDRLPDPDVFPLRDSVSAVSVGLVEGRPMLDLCYAEDSAGRCIYSAEYYSQWHICYRYDSAGKLATLARYNGDSLYGYEEYSYDAAGKLIFIRYHETDGSVYTETFVYDDAGNCVAFIPAGGFNDGNRIEYSYQKDDRGRLGSWTELRLESSTGKIEKTVYTVKYFTDGYVLVYRDADKDTLIEGDVFVPSSKLRDALNTVSGLSFRNSLLSTDVLPESAEMDDYRYSDYDSESFFGLPHDYKIGMRREWYRGQLPRDILIFGAWNYNPGDPTTSGVWYNWYETNKGELLTGVYSQEGNGGYTEYRYDESNRLVQEDYLNFTEDRTVTYRYDSQGHLVEREREFADTDTITGLDIHTKTVYRYTYNEGNTLDGMTAEVVSIPGNEKLSSTVLTVYKDRSSATISYGDLTQYLGMKASDLIRTVGKNYSYEPDYATDVALTFDGSVIFYIQDSSDTLNPDGKVGAIRVFYSSDIPSSGRNLGNGIHFGMKYSEIKAVFGAALGTPSASELDPGSELLYDSAVVGGYYYLFTWGPNAVENDEQPAVVLIKQEG